MRFISKQTMPNKKFQGTAPAALPLNLALCDQIPSLFPFRSRNYQKKNIFSDFKEQKPDICRMLFVQKSAHGRELV